MHAKFLSALWMTLNVLAFMECSVLNIAHRGSSGQRPEHTQASYSLAIAQGTDVIECDVCLSRDLVPVCLHESWIGDNTNVADVFPGRENTYYIDDLGINITDHFSVDFTFSELQRVKHRQRFGSRDDGYDDQFSIVGLEEYIDIAQAANRSIGIYPETKHPAFVNNLDIVKQRNTTFEEILVNTLSSKGYDKFEDNCYLQSFSEDSIRSLAQRSSLKKIMLLTPVDDVSNERLRSLSEVCYGIGPHKQLITEVDPVSNRITHVTDLIPRAHGFNLSVHVFTLRNEHSYMPFDYGLDPYAEYSHFQQLNIDGIFTDFPATMRRSIKEF